MGETSGFGLIVRAQIFFWHDNRRGGIQVLEELVVGAFDWEVDFRDLDLIC